jgi:hypothetical protein
MGERERGEMRNFSIRPCGTSRVLLHAVKSYDMGPSRFTSHPRGRCAADFIALKNPSPWPGFEPATDRGFPNFLILPSMQMPG